MALTLNFIAEQFNMINRKHFNNELLTPRFEITHVKGYLGQYHWKYSYDSRIFIDSVIRISDMFDRSDADITNTIAHEIIHLYIRQNKIKDTRPHHGKVFNSIADRLNKEGGFHIARTDSVDGCGLRNKSEIKIYHVACFVTQDNRFFQFVMNQNYLNYYIQRIDNYPHCFRNAYIFTSMDDKRFANYPSCRGAVRGHYISESVFNEQRENETLIKNTQTLGTFHKVA